MSQKKVLPRRCKSDICLKQISLQHGFLATTKGMATKPKYWSLLKKVSLSKGWFHLLPVSKDDIYQLALTTSASNTPWFLCPQCASVAEVKTHSHAVDARQYYSAGRPKTDPSLVKVNSKDSSSMIADKDGFNQAFEAAMSASKDRC